MQEYQGDSPLNLYQKSINRIEIALGEVEEAISIMEMFLVYARQHREIMQKFPKDLHTERLRMVEYRAGAVFGVMNERMGTLSKMLDLATEANAEYIVSEHESDK